MDLIRKLYVKADGFARGQTMAEYALIVAAVYGAIAAVLAVAGKSKVQQGVPPVPEQTVESVKEDVEWTRQRAKDGRR